MATKPMKYIVVSMQRVLQVSSEEEIVINVPQNVGEGELRQFIETHITCEPWRSYAEISVTGDYDGEDWDRLSVDVVCGLASASTPDVTVVRNANGKLTVL